MPLLFWWELFIPRIRDENVVLHLIGWDMKCCQMVGIKLILSWSHDNLLSVGLWWGGSP